MTSSGPSAAEVAARQAAYWKGAGGKGWLAAIERIERSIGGFGTTALAAADVRPGERVIDVGCGLGGTTAALAAKAEAVLGIDISDVLIEAAKAKKIARAEFLVADAATHPFDTATYDLVFSRFGVMFFADPVAAFRNLRRALKPEGRMVFVCWRTGPENPWGTAPARAAAPFLPPLPKPGPEDPGQFAFGDRARVERILTEAGFGELSIQPVDQPVFLGKSIDDILENAGQFGPLSLAFADATPDQLAQAKAAIADMLKPHVQADGVRLPGACWLVSAKPG